MCNITYLIFREIEGGNFCWSIDEVTNTLKRIHNCEPHVQNSNENVKPNNIDTFASRFVI